MSYTYLFKYIIIGDTSVGKSCMLMQLLDGQFRQRHEITIGVEFGSKLMKVKNTDLKLQIWDTAGQESFRSITRGYYRSAAAALLVYDITNVQSFKNVSKWLEEARMYGNPNLEVILVGNKSDLEAERKVSYEQGAILALDKGIQFLEVSAKTASKVEEAFKQVAEKILTKIESGIFKVDKSTPGIKTGVAPTNQVLLIPLSPEDAKKPKTTCC